ncbi:unnamed protein product, partial [Rotaria magnacalcarata]
LETINIPDDDDVELLLSLTTSFDDNLQSLLLLEIESNRDTGKLS